MTHTQLPAGPSQPPEGASRSSGRNLFLAGAGLFVLVLALYRPSLSARYVRLDDYQYVVDNQLVRHPSPSAAGRFFSEVTRPSTVAGYYQPLTMVSLMLDVVLAGTDTPGPFVFHLTNVLLHAGTSILVLLLLRGITGGLVLPFLAALLFAVHPAQVESVAWISQRKTVLASLFAVACILCYLKYGRTKRRGLLHASLALYLVAGLAKPTVMLIPLVLPLLDYWPLERGVVRSLREKWPFAVLMIIMGQVAWVSQVATASMMRPTLGGAAAVLKWILLLSYNAMLYAGNVLWPFHLSPYREVPENLALSNPQMAMSLLGVAAIATVWIVSFRRARPLFVGLTAFVIVLAPALGPVRFMVSCVADRFVYLPMVFLMLPLVVAGHRLSARLRRRPYIAWSGLALLALPLAILSRAQQRVWMDSKTLWSHCVQAVPDLVKGHSNLAQLYLEEEALDEALFHVRKVLDHLPDRADSLHLLGRIYIRTGNPDEAKAAIEQAIDIGLGRFEDKGYLSLAEVYVIMGDRDEADRALSRSVALGCDPAKAYADLADTAMRFAGRPDWASDFYNKAAEHDPDNVSYLWNAGTALHADGRYGEALGVYDRTLEMGAEKGMSMSELKAVAEKLRRQIRQTATAPAER